jgi:hypothetical protein
MLADGINISNKIAHQLYIRQTKWYSTFELIFYFGSLIGFGCQADEPQNTSTAESR